MSRDLISTGSALALLASPLFSSSILILVAAVDELAIPPPQATIIVLMVYPSLQLIRLRTSSWHCC
jgi:hypothetical protein